MAFRGFDEGGWVRIKMGGISGVRVVYMIPLSFFSRGSDGVGILR
jgi:hypothetical protein